MDQKEGTSRCELKVARQLLGSLPSLEGKTVTADPLHCQKQTAHAIIDKGGDYLLQIKANQPTLLKLAHLKPEQTPFLPKPAPAMAESRPAR
jgi:predicted transposase YbfD/YdcC